MPTLDIALKEWQAVCTALVTGRQCILLRKGGIHEVEGKFELETSKFLLFPTYLHQNIDWIKPPDRKLADQRSAEPETIQVPGYATVEQIWQVKSREQMERLDADHIYLPPLIDMRFNYRPENPLYLLLVRTYRLHQPTTVDNTPAYAGCKSWVPLDQSIPTGDALPVLDDVKYEHRRKGILDRVGAAART